MFVRFRTAGARLQPSIVETERRDGRVRQTYIASLGSLPNPPSANDRAVFWAGLPQRLARLGNRIDPDNQAAILAQIHERLPMASIAERKDAQLARARDDERFWSQIAEMQTETAEAYRQLAVKAGEDAAKADAAAIDAKSHRDRTKARLADIEAGKLGPDTTAKPLSREDMRKMMGITRAEMQHCVRLSMIAEILGDEAFWRENREHFDQLQKRQSRAERAHSSAAPGRIARRARRASITGPSAARPACAS
jgi:hypothetical protein